MAMHNELWFPSVIWSAVINNVDNGALKKFAYDILYFTFTGLSFVYLNFTSGRPGFEPELSASETDVLPLTLPPYETSAKIAI